VSRNLKAITVSCFGKLPQFGDFVRINASSQELHHFDRWLQEGLYSAKKSLVAQFDSTFDASHIRRFLFPLPELQRMLIGVLIPGQDSVGRRYPFYYTVSLPVSRLKKEPLSHQILHILPFLNNSVDTHDTVLEMEQISDIASHLEEMSRWISPENNRLIREYQNWKQHAAASELLSSTNEGEQAWSILLDELRKPIPSTHKLGWFLEKPAINSLQSFLVPVIVDIFRNTNTNIPSVFWDNPTEGSGTIQFFPTQPTAKILVDLIKNTPSSAHFHSDSAAGVTVDSNAMSAHLRDTLQNVSLNQFIQSFAR
jgi:type VI secretion system ImpM family protein